MESLYNRYKDKGFEILAVNAMESEKEVIAFMNENGLSFPAALDEDGKVGSAYGIQAIPTTFILDRDGKIVVRFVGSIDWDTEKLHAALDALLKS
jgi:peroxiredoxin